MRVLGVDYGGSRTGLAISDVEGVTCRPVKVIAERDMDKVVQAIMAVAAEEGAGAVVVGLPRPLSGGTNRQMQDVLCFVDGLRTECSLPVETWDERFTSRLAEKGSHGVGSRDAVAACYMLQNYLDRLSAENRG